MGAGGGARSQQGPIVALDQGQCLVVMRYWGFTYPGSSLSRMLRCARDDCCKLVSVRRLVPVSQLVVERVGVIHRKIWKLPAFAGTNQCPTTTNGALVFPLLA